MLPPRGRAALLRKGTRRGVSFCHLTTACRTSLLSAAIVSFQSFYLSSTSRQAASALYVVVVVLPVTLSIAIAVDNKFRHSAQSKILLAAADYIESEIYKYRSRGGAHASNRNARPGSVMRSRTPPGMSMVPPSSCTQLSTALVSVRARLTTSSPRAQAQSRRCAPSSVSFCMCTYHRMSSASPTHSDRTLARSHMSTAAARHYVDSCFCSQNIPRDRRSPTLLWATCP